MWAFILFVISVEVGGEVDDVESVTVREGGVLRLHSRVVELKGNLQILWTAESGSQSARVAQMYHGNIYTHYDERFTGRVQLEQQTGSLTISNIRSNESGIYKALIVNNKQIAAREYKVNVYATVSVPAMSSSSLDSVHQSPVTLQESLELCSLICSVRNDQDVFISWYKGGEMLNQTRSSDLSINLSLPLHLHYNDTENYSCTAANPVSNKTIYLQMKDFCTQYEDCQQYCGDVEVVVRLVLSGLVGIASVVFSG
ncbi:SLAM family member 5-like [Xyrauchen texanus]|uniref:SLAM family member 5-like n=1 Tax=Xyrauchen texanus TaxID=154827 RepID=UPI002241A0D6|nr:SLAM family member 5-like [Xyrauchen texanus]